MRKKKQYSDFVQEKVFEIHEAVISYLDERRNEDRFWDLQEKVERYRVAIPEHIYIVIQNFIDQYLEIDLYEVTAEKKDNNGFDFSKYELLEIRCPQPEIEEEYITWFKLKTMYDAIAMEYIRPVFVV